MTLVVLGDVEDEVGDGVGFGELQHSQDLDQGEAVAVVEVDGVGGLGLDGGRVVASGDGAC